MGLSHNLSTIHTNTIATILNFNSGKNRHGLKNVTCKQTFRVVKSIMVYTVSFGVISTKPRIRGTKRDFGQLEGENERGMTIGQRIHAKLPIATAFENLSTARKKMYGTYGQLVNLQWELRVMDCAPGLNCRLVPPVLYPHSLTLYGHTSCKFPIMYWIFVYFL